MKLLLLFSLFSVLIVASHGYEYLTSMSWRPGDRIGCRLTGIQGWIQSKHWMLAADNEDLIHIVGSDDDGYVLKEKKWAINSDHFDVKKCVNEGQGSHGGTAVTRALAMVGTKKEYSKLTCNSKNYVEHWANGEQICKSIFG